MLKKCMFLMVIALLLSVTNSLQAASVSLVADADGHVGNSTTGSGGVEDDGFNNGSAVNVRDIAVRRHVGFLQYNIGALAGDVFSNMSFSIFSANNSGDPIEVYGIIESQDDFAPGQDVETAYTWNTAPGVFNSPTPPDGDPVQLDPNDTFGGAPLFLFNPPGSGIRASTPVSSLLADFLNADTDGTVVFMLVTENLGDVGTFRSSEHSSQGTFLEGDVTFDIIALADIMLGNDANLGPDASDNGSGIHIRDITARRRVGLLEWDLSSLLSNGQLLTNVSFSIFGTGTGELVDVYGIIESQDDLAPGDDVEDLTWNTAPGLKNDPAPSLSSPIVLDLADVVGGAPLMTFTAPATATRESTPISQAMADFINDDLDGTVFFLFASPSITDESIIRSTEHSSTGTHLEGDFGHAFNPNPSHRLRIPASITAISWTLPDPNSPGSIVTCDVVFGSDPNIINGVLQAGSNTLLVDNQAVETAAVSLVTDIKYYWQITAIFSDGAASEVSRVFIFDTDNVVPIADAGADVETWLIGGTRDVQLAGASIDPDGPVANYLWEVTASPGPGTASLDDPALANATVTVIAAGSYTLSLVVDDSKDTSAAPDTMTITVYSDACVHAQAQPGYVAPIGDTNGDCVVDMLDLANVASTWLEDTNTPL